MENIDIAIIGTGPAGLVALKNLREQGFNAVAFERRESVGALDDTTVNVSKFVFQITRHFRLVDKCNNTLKLTRHISIFTSTSDLESQYTGFCETLQILNGTFIVHILMASLYKKNDLDAKRVMVVGIGNTGCDIAMSLCKHVSKTYLAYRRGRFVVSRYENSGVPTDSQIPWPVLRLKYLMDYYLPTLSKWATDKFMTNKMINDSAKHEPDDGKISERQRLGIAEKRIRGEWRLVPCPSMAHRNPAAQEDIFPAFHNKDIIPMQGFVDFAGEDTVLLADGTTVEVDVVIFATGYRHDFSIMPELEMNGAAGMGLQIAKTTEKEQTPEDKEQEPSLPRLYQMVFPPKRATSIAFLSWLAPQEAVWCVSELASMAVAQAWVADFALKQNHNLPTPYQPSSILPTEKEMEADVDLYHTWWRKEWKTDHSMMEGYSWRLFDTNPDDIPGCGRKAWAGARTAVQETICKRIIAFKETCLDADSKSYVLATSGSINNNPEHSNENMTHGFIIEFRNDAHRVYFLNVDVAYKEVFEHIDPNYDDFLALGLTDGVYGPSLMQ
ncbi:hypothetical protein FGSG_07846 [Fusarium graminearum PH-1]|uniref:FAD/NAD(P)-binding domain-containing protein n=1 Tax=Gibberella zeae (strain ATCC MYA-4620 / CBS 123657 / FGSC 9075 / NRRL 31084 / PH-1) TaxID=229533 RepID=I1RUF5_GIBZE|nr:hypothetical protein FGSG_07846 [Fusarium graminearum PH-1]ESU14164.1 hypothetical protein FGSG_07846 [Fusarium graminearum PH-1]|eukprot:XP_011327671.1 hypothetical protein FGSG_07846 [Fusarium graminearum PH-1]